MANVNGGLVANQNRSGLAPSGKAPVKTVKGLLSDVNYKKRFEEILGKKAAGFISSIVNISNTPALRDCDPMSIISSAVVAATLDLPIDPNLGQSYIVPYMCSEVINGKKTKVKKAQFQIGYKGFIQLAMRSGQYKTINATPIYEGEILSVNRLSGEIKMNDEGVSSDKIVGYAGYFRLLNGFEKVLYMTNEQITKHGKKYSQSFKSDKNWVVEQSLWTTDFEGMAQKTVLKLLLSKYGILSIDMQQALNADQAVIKNEVADGEAFDSTKIDYVDNHKEEVEATDADYIAVDGEETYKDTPFEAN